MPVSAARSFGVSHPKMQGRITSYIRQGIALRRHSLPLMMITWVASVAIFTQIYTNGVGNSSNLIALFDPTNMFLSNQDIPASILKKFPSSPIQEMRYFSSLGWERIPNIQLWFLAHASYILLALVLVTLAMLFFHRFNSFVPSRRKA